MTQPERIQLLLQKERDGELTQVEAEELTRSLWLLPEARREREVWQRLERATKSNPAPRLNTAQLAGRIVTGLDARAASTARPRPPVWFALALSGAVAAVAAIGLWSRPDAHPERVVQKAAPIYAVKKPRPHAPVEVDLGDPRAQHEVEVRF